MTIAFRPPPFMRERLGNFLKTEQVGEIPAHVEDVFVQLQGTADLEPSGRAAILRASFDLAAG